MWDDFLDLCVDHDWFYYTVVLGLPIVGGLLGLLIGLALR